MTEAPADPRPTVDSVGERILARLESSDALSAVSERVHPIVKKAVGENSLQDALTGRWLGHPVHPAGVILPMSCWFASSMLDVVGGRRSRRSAQRLVGLGALAAAPVVATGAADWLYTGDAERRVGTAHALANNVATALFAGSWWSRRRGRHGIGIGLGLAGTAVTAGASYLGGHLTYRRGVGVNTTAYQSGPTEFGPLSLDSSISATEVTRGSFGTLSFAVVDGDASDEVHVMESRCTHRGAPLHDGDVVDGCVTCPWHGSRFDLETGAVRQGPATIPQPVYESRWDDGELLIRRSEVGGLRSNVVDARRSG